MHRRIDFINWSWMRNIHLIFKDNFTKIRARTKNSYFSKNKRTKNPYKVCSSSHLYYLIYVSSRWQWKSGYARWVVKWKHNERMIIILPLTLLILFVLLHRMNRAIGHLYNRRVHLCHLCQNTLFVRYIYIIDNVCGMLTSYVEVRDELSWDMMRAKTRI